MNSMKFNVNQYLNELSREWNKEIGRYKPDIEKLRNIYFRLVRTFARTQHMHKMYSLRGQKWKAEDVYSNVKLMYDRLNIWREMLEEHDINGEKLDKLFPAPTLK